MKWTEFLLCLSFLFLPRVGEIGQEGESSSTLTHLAHVTQASTYSPTLVMCRLVHRLKLVTRLPVCRGGQQSKRSSSGQLDQPLTEQQDSADVIFISSDGDQAEESGATEGSTDGQIAEENYSSNGRDTREKVWIRCH